MKGGGKFEDLEVWKRSVRLCADIYKVFCIRKISGLRIKLPVLHYLFRQILQKDMNGRVIRKLLTL